MNWSIRKVNQLRVAERVRAMGLGLLFVGSSLWMSCFLGCGTTKSVTATEQLLMSDAVDATVSQIDFRPLSGYKIFLDTTYMSSAGKSIPGVPMTHNLVTSDYVISSLRQQLTAAGCMLVDTKDLAEIICEARVGALGTDGHNMTYGLPASNVLSSASTLITATPSLPIIPELSIAKKEVKSAAAKVAVFAYDRETREPLWQSGVAQAGSNAKDSWFMGVGPIQQGTIYRGTRFAGDGIGTGGSSNDEYPLSQTANGVEHRSQVTFAHPIFSKSQDGVITERIAKDEVSGDSKGSDGKGVAAKLTSDSKRSGATPNASPSTSPNASPSNLPSASKPAGAPK